MKQFNFTLTGSKNKLIVTSLFHKESFIITLNRGKDTYYREQEISTADLLLSMRKNLSSLFFRDENGERYVEFESFKDVEPFGFNSGVCLEPDYIFKQEYDKEDSVFFNGVDYEGRLSIESKNHIQQHEVTGEKGMLKIQELPPKIEGEKCRIELYIEDVGDSYLPEYFGEGDVENTGAIYARCIDFLYRDFTGCPYLTVMFQH